MNQQLAYLLLTNDGVLGLCYLPLIQKGSSYKFSMEIKYASMSERKKTHLGEFLTLNTWDPAFYIGRGLCPFKAKCLTQCLWLSASLHSTLTLEPGPTPTPITPSSHNTHLEIIMRKYRERKSRKDRTRILILVVPAILGNIKMLLNTRNGMVRSTIIQIRYVRSSWWSNWFLHCVALFIQLMDFSSEDHQTC